MHHKQNFLSTFEKCTKPPKPIQHLRSHVKAQNTYNINRTGISQKNTSPAKNPTRKVSLKAPFKTGDMNIPRMSSRTMNQSQPRREVDCVFRQMHFCCSRGDNDVHLSPLPCGGSLLSFFSWKLMPASRKLELWRCRLWKLPFRARGIFCKEAIDGMSLLVKMHLQPCGWLDLSRKF